MSNTKTKIEWTDKTWNPTTGCSKISSGCLNCYAEEITNRFPQAFPNGFEVTLHESRLQEPYKWKKSSKIFVNSMSDLFHEEIPISFVQKVFNVARDNPRHVFQVLTKRHKRMLEEAPNLTWYDNIWMGVSVENQQVIERVDYLRQIPAKVRFLSCEPLLSDLSLDLSGIQWVIAGGESGSGHRLIKKKEWVENILAQCLDQKVPFFFKQWGGRLPSSNGRLLNGVEWNQFPR